MKALPRYTATLIGIAALAGVVAAPFLDGPARLALAAAVALTVPTQVLLFGLLVRARHDFGRFLAWWGAGVLGRMAVVGLLGAAVRVLPLPAPGMLLLATIGFFFVFLLLEAAFLARHEEAPEYA